jgi:hypothetical protein
MSKSTHPSPCCAAVAESSANNWSQDGASSPGQTEQCIVDGSLCVGREHGNICKTTVAVSITVSVELQSYPRYIPAPPIPAMTRPKIKAVMLGAAPQMALPISKRITAVMIIHLMLNSPKLRPMGRMVATEAIGNPRPTHGKCSISPSDSYTAP